MVTAAEAPSEKELLAVLALTLLPSTDPAVPPPPPTDCSRIAWAPDPVLRVLSPVITVRGSGEKRETLPADPPLPPAPPMEKLAAADTLALPPSALLVTDPPVPPPPAMLWANTPIAPWPVVMIRPLRDAVTAPDQPPPAPLPPLAADAPKEYSLLAVPVPSALEVTDPPAPPPPPTDCSNTPWERLPEVMNVPSP